MNLVVWEIDMVSCSILSNEVRVARRLGCFWKMNMGLDRIVDIVLMGCVFE